MDYAQPSSKLESHDTTTLLKEFDGRLDALEASIKPVEAARNFLCGEPPPETSATGAIPLPDSDWSLCDRLQSRIRRLSRLTDRVDAAARALASL